MSQLVIEIDSEENEAILLSLLPKLNGRVISKNNSPTEETKRSLLKDVFNQLSLSGVAEKYGDPVEWQKGNRQDKPLSGRDE